MNKKVVLLAVLLGLGLIIPGCTGQEADQKTETVTPDVQIAVADLNQVLVESAAGQAGTQFMEGLSAELEQEVEELRKAADQNQTQDAEKLVASKVSRNRAKLDQEKRRINKILNLSLQEAIAAYREKQGIEIIFPNTAPATYDGSIDVTAGILAEMNSMDIDITAPVDVGTGLVPFDGNVISQ